MARLALVVFVVLAGPSISFAQTVGGAIRGVVRDEQGGLLPGVTLTTTAQSLVAPRVTVTDERGTYQFALLPPGVYGLKAELQGFRPKVVQEIHVQVGQEIQMNVMLEIARISETLEVKAQVPTVAVSRADLSKLIGQEVISEIPLS